MKNNIKIMLANYLLKVTSAASNTENDGIQLMPEAVKIEDRYIKVNDTFRRIYYLGDLPADGILPGILQKILFLPIPMKVTFHIEETPNNSIIKTVRNSRSVLEAQQNERIKQGKNRKEEIDITIDQANEFIDNLVSGQERAFNVGVYLSLEAKSRRQMMRYASMLKNTCDESFVRFTPYSFGQYEAFGSILPFNNDVVGKTCLMQTSLAAYTLPFISKDFTDPNGILLGRNRISGSLILYDLFKARNSNIGIFGTSGSGKSVLAKLISMRLWLRGNQILIIDPEGEYARLARFIGGTVVKFKKGNGINPFQYAKEFGNDHKEAAQLLKTFFKFFIQVQNYDGSILDKALIDTLNSEDASISSLIERLGDLPCARDLEVLTSGSLSGIFDTGEEIDTSNDYLVFDISNLDSEELKAPIMFLLTASIFSMVKNRNRKKMLFIDEAHVLLENAETAIFYKNLVKRARKYRTGIVSITQNVEDFLNDKGNFGKGIVTNTESVILLKQSYTSIPVVGDAFNLTSSEREIIPSFGIGEALLIREKEHVPLFIEPFEFESELIFT